MYRVGVMVINDAGDSDILEAVWEWSGCDCACGVITERSTLNGSSSMPERSLFALSCDCL
jgi:hypothetical protein